MTNKPHETLLELVERLDKRNDGSVVGNRNIAAHYPRLSRAVREMHAELKMTRERLADDNSLDADKSIHVLLKRLDEGGGE